MFVLTLLLSETQIGSFGSLLFPLESALSFPCNNIAHTHRVVKSCGGIQDIPEQQWKLGPILCVI